MAVHVRTGFGAAKRELQSTYTPSSAVAELLDQQVAEAEERTIDFFRWAKRVPEPKSGTLDFERWPFQRELYEAPDIHNVVVKKATQVGVSAFLVRWTMFWADTRGLTAIYVFPKSKQLLDFSDTRIRPLVLGSEYLRDRVPPLHVQNKGLKQIGFGFVYYRGSESTDDLQSVDADVLALDEYDDLVQANIPDAERRLSGSEYGYVRRVGVPSLPQFGIAKMYDASDQRRWRVKCEHCNHWQLPNFADNVDQNLVMVVCAKCLKKLNVRKGEWVADHPDRDVRGYHIPRLIAPINQHRLKEIIEASRSREEYRRQVFFNKDLGEEYASESGRLSPTAISGAQREYVTAEAYDGENPVTMGIDVASARGLHVRISEHLTERTKRALFIGELTDDDGEGPFDKLAKLMERYSVNMACIDHLPEMRLARSLAERFPGRVYLVSYSNQTDVLTVDDVQRNVKTRRLEAIDATMEMIRSQRNMLPINLPPDYVQHLMAPVRFQEQDDLGKMTVAYRSTGPDDFLHAEVYDVVATECWWIRQQVVEADREVFRPLEEMMEFQRSATHDDIEEHDYHPGFDEDQPYSDGFTEE